jgi:hypothetical protein
MTRGEGSFAARRIPFAGIQQTLAAAAGLFYTRSYE